MTLNLTKDELKQLLVLVCIGDWIKNADFEGSKDENPELCADKKIMQKLMAATHKAKMTGLVEYLSQYKEYFETCDLENEFMSYINAYVETEFWEDLATRMAKRDLFAEFGNQGIEKMSDEERMLKVMERSDWYDEKFEEDGLLHLHIDKTGNKNLH